MITTIPTNTKISATPNVTAENDQSDNINKYSKFGITGTSSLAFREIPRLFNQYVNGKNGIDYGCGAGRSTRFLESLDTNPHGVDISKDMIALAKQLDPVNRYSLITDGKIPVADKTADFIFSSFVFLVLDMPTMDHVLQEMSRVLKDTAPIIISTGSEKIHSRDMNWVSYNTDFEENRDLSSGAIVKLGIKDTGAEFFDYNWHDKDYRQAFERNGFQVTEMLSPIANNDGNEWKSELEHSPCTVYVLHKTK